MEERTAITQGQFWIPGLGDCVNPGGFVICSLDCLKKKIDMLDFRSGTFGEKRTSGEGGGLVVLYLFLILEGK